MKLFVRLILVFLSFGATQAQAGWVSGGGQLLSDAQNPWYVQNTKTVYFCIVRDEKHFSASEDIALKAIRDAMNYWIESFKKPNRRESELVEYKIATQSFAYVPCRDPKVDIRFQLGTLESEQFAYLDDPRRFVGVSVRTDYDIAKKHSKGFVYISPDSGPLRYSLPNSATSTWDLYDGFALRLILIHELGHIFGVPHLNDERGTSFMHPQFAERVLTKGFIEYVVDSRAFQNPSPYFEIQSIEEGGALSTAYCWSRREGRPTEEGTPSIYSGKSVKSVHLVDIEVLAKYFGFPDSDSGCLTLSVEDNGRTVRVSFGDSDGENLEVLGVFNPTVPVVEWDYYHFINRGLFYDSVTRKATNLMGIPTLKFNARFQPLNPPQEVKSAGVSIDPFGRVSVAATIEGKTYVDLFH